MAEKDIFEKLVINEKALTLMAGPLINDIIKNDEAGTDFQKNRAKVAEDLMTLATTYLKELDMDEEGHSDTLFNGVLWVSSFLDSVKVKGNDSLINAPMLANMGPLSEKMKRWFGWEQSLFDEVRKNMNVSKAGFRLGKVKRWIEKCMIPESLAYYQDMTGIKLSEKARNLIDNTVPRDRILDAIEANMIDEEVEMYADSSMFILKATELESFLRDDDRYKNQDQDLEWDRNSIWTEALQSFVSESAETSSCSSDISMKSIEAPQPPLTKNLVDRLNMLHEISGKLNCIALTTDNRPCPKLRVANSMYCNCHQSLGSAFGSNITKQIFNPDLIQHKYQIIRGVWVKTPSTNPKVLSRRMKASIEGTNWEFDSQMAVMEHLLRRLFNAGLKRTQQERQQDIIPEKELIKEFGKLKYTTYSQVYRATREKIFLLGLDPNVRWTKYSPYFRLQLGAHFGFLDPEKSMGYEEVEFITNNWFPTNSKWSGSMDEIQDWRRRGESSRKIPALNHKFNHGGLDTPIRLKDGVRTADMNATPLFRLVYYGYSTFFLNN